MNTIWQYINSRLQIRLIAILVPLLVIPFIVLSIFLINQNLANLTNNIEQQEEERLRYEFVELSQALGTLDNDLRMLANLPSTLSLAQAIIANDVDAIATERNLLEDNFAAVSDARRIYQQVRFLDNRGLEIVRVDYDQTSGEVITITGNALQPKDNTDYFINSIGLPEGSIYVSAMNLNREGIDRDIQVLDDGSFVPVLRYAKPIYVQNNTTGLRQVGGVVVTNVYAEAVLDPIRSVEGADSIVYLLNEDGYFLLNTESPDQVFGFEEGLEQINTNLNLIQANINNVYSPRLYPFQAA